MVPEVSAAQRAQGRAERLARQFRDGRPPRQPLDRHGQWRPQSTGSQDRDLYVLSARSQGRDDDRFECGLGAAGGQPWERVGGRLARRARSSRYAHGPGHPFPSRSRRSDLASERQRVAHPRAAHRRAARRHAQRRRPLRPEDRGLHASLRKRYGGQRGPLQRGRGKGRESLAGGRQLRRAHRSPDGAFEALQDRSPEPPESGGGLDPGGAGRQRRERVAGHRGRTVLRGRQDPGDEALHDG